MGASFIIGHLLPITYEDLRHNIIINRERHIQLSAGIAVFLPSCFTCIRFLAFRSSVLLPSLVFLILSRIHIPFATYRSLHWSGPRKHFALYLILSSSFSLSASSHRFRTLHFRHFGSLSMFHFPLFFSLFTFTASYESLSPFVVELRNSPDVHSSSFPLLSSLAVTCTLPTVFRVPRTQRP